MRAQWQQLVEHLEAAGARALIVAQNEGIADWLRTNVDADNASCPLDVLILPDTMALSKWMGRPPDWTHRAEIALNLATAAYRNLCQSGGQGQCVGVALVGPHFADTGGDSQYVATQTADETRLYLSHNRQLRIARASGMKLSSIAVWEHSRTSSDTPGSRNNAYRSINPLRSFHSAPNHCCRTSGPGAHTLSGQTPVVCLMRVLRASSVQFCRARSTRSTRAICYCKRRPNASWRCGLF